jgi:hypothetical protein
MRRISWLLSIVCTGASGMLASAQFPDQPPLNPAPPLSVPSSPPAAMPIAPQLPIYSGVRVISPLGPIVPEPVADVRGPMAFPVLPPTTYVTNPGWRYRDVYGPNPPAPLVPKKTGFFGRTYDHFFGPDHRYEPDGVPTPVGAGNCFTEFKYVFGSARQYFGTADASVGHLYNTRVPPPYRIPYLQEPHKIAVPVEKMPISSGPVE